MARYGLWIWTLMVIASTLFTKRHATIDVATGVIFGWIVYRLMFEPIHQEAGDSEAIVEGLEIRDRLIGQPEGTIGALERNAIRRLREFAISVTLAAIGTSISSWAIAHSSVTTFVVGVLTTTFSLNLFLRLIHDGMHSLLVPDLRCNWIVTALLGSTFLMSFTACRVLLGRYLRPPRDLRDPNEHPIESRSGRPVRFLHVVRLMWVLLLNVILMPVSALRFGSATQRKLICSEYALLFLMCSILLRSFSARTLLLLWILPVVLAGLFAVVQGFSQLALKDDLDQYLATRT